MEEGDTIYFYPETSRLKIEKGIYVSDIDGESSFVLINTKERPYKVSRCDIEKDEPYAKIRYLEEQLEKLKNTHEQGRYEHNKSCAELNAKINRICNYLKIPTQYW